MNDRQLRQILDQALKDRAPGAYKQIKRRGQLATYLDSLIVEAMASISADKDRIPEELMGLTDPMQRVQKAEMIAKAAEEVALSNAIEALPLEVTEDEMEADEPMTLEELTGDYWRNRMLDETEGR